MGHTLRLAIASTSLALFAITAVAEERIKIGVPVPLSGAAAAYGTDIRNAIVFANKHLAGSAYELVIEDDHCNDRDAVQIAHKLVDVDRVKYVLGFGCSGTVLASAPVYEKAKAVVIASGTGAPLITHAGDYIFRTKPSLDIAAEILAKDMAAKYKKVGILTEETAYCKGLTDAVVRNAAALGVETFNESYLPGNEDFRSMLVKLKSKGAEAVFLNPQGEPGLISLYKQLMGLNWKAPVYGTFAPGSPAFLEALGAQADGIIYADLAFNEDMLNARGRAIWSEFEKEYGKVKSADHYAALSFASFSALHEALQSGKGDDVKTFLYTHTFRETVDSYSFDKNGDVVSDKLTYVLKTVKDAAPARYTRN